MIQRNSPDIVYEEKKILDNKKNQNMKHSIIDYSKGRIFKNKNSVLTPIREGNTNVSKKIDNLGMDKNNNNENDTIYINSTQSIHPEKDLRNVNNSDYLIRQSLNKTTNKEYLFEELVSIKGKIVSNKNQSHLSNKLFTNPLQGNIENENYSSNNNNERTGIVISQKLN